MVLSPFILYFVAIKKGLYLVRTCVSQAGWKPCLRYGACAMAIGPKVIINNLRLPETES